MALHQTSVYTGVSARSLNRRTDVRAWGFTAESMNMIIATDGAVAVAEVAGIDTDTLIAEFTTPAEPRRMLKPARAAYNARQNAIADELQARGVEVDGLKDRGV